MGEGLYTKIGAWAGALGVLASLLTWHLSRQPRDLTPELARELTGLVRELRADGDMSSEERQRLAAFAVDNQLRLAAVESLERELAGRLRAAAGSLSRGLELGRQGRHEEARVEFASAVASDPDDAAAWASLGAACMLTDRPGEARDAYDRALALAPDDWRVRYNFGFFFARLGNAEAALEQLATACDLLDRQGTPADRRLALADLGGNEVLAGLRRDPRFQDLLERFARGDR